MPPRTSTAARPAAAPAAPAAPSPAAQAPARPALGAAPWPATHAGRLLAGRHRLRCLVSEGPRGQLWQAHDEELDLAVAIVVPREAVAEQCLAAAAEQARVCSVGIARVFDAGSVGGTPAVVREWVPGVPLDEALPDALPVPPALEAAATLADALAAAHRKGVCSGAVSPGSVVLRRALPVLTDLGHVPSCRGRFDAEEPPVRDAAADVRAVGAVLHALLTGCWPLDDDRPRPGLPPASRGRGGRLRLPGQVRPDVPRLVDTVADELLTCPAPGRLPELADVLRDTARRLRAGTHVRDSRAGTHVRDRARGLRRRSSS